MPGSRTELPPGMPRPHNIPQPSSGTAGSSRPSGTARQSRAADAAESSRPTNTANNRAAQLAAAADARRKNRLPTIDVDVEHPRDADISAFRDRLLEKAGNPECDTIDFGTTTTWRIKTKLKAKQVAALIDFGKVEDADNFFESVDVTITAADLEALQE
jgi:hypothetical protein